MMLHFGAMRAAFVVLLATLAVAPFVPARAACPKPAQNHPPARWHDQYLWQTLAAHHYHIGDIAVHVAQVYELDKPGQDTWYGRLADSLHIETRPAVVRNQLLFGSGDPVSAARIYQTERRLRGYKFLRKAVIVPTACHGDVVDVAVNVKDAWTLKPEVAFERIGGQNLFSFQVKDENLLGLGKTIALGHVHHSQRNENYLNYFDPAVAGSRWQLFANASQLTHGYSRGLSLTRPFFADTTAWAGSAKFLTRKANLYFYNHGRRGWAATGRTRQFALAWRHLLGFDGGTGWRAGVRYVDESWRYGPPVAIEPTLRPRPRLTDRQFRGVQATASYFEDRYSTFHNLEMIGRAEDYNLGLTASAAVGYFPTALGSSSDAWIGDINATYGIRLPFKSVAFFNIDIDGRRTRGAFRGAEAGLVATWYNQLFNKQTLVAHLAAHWQLRPNPEEQLYLGGLSGLRGYRNYFRAGDRRWLVSLEDRIVTGATILNTLRVGFVGFFDAGQIDRYGEQHWSRVFSDIGGGLRFGNLRGAFANVIYLTIAFPLTRPRGVSPYQIEIGDVVNF
jgi:hypothetical protein